MRFRLSPAARLDLLGIRLELERENPTAAIRYRSLFIEAFKLLGAYPRAGRARPDLEGHNTRSWPVRPYLIIYEVRSKHLDVLRVVHGARDLPALSLHDPGSED